MEEICQLSHESLHIDIIYEVRKESLLDRRAEAGLSF